MKFTSVLAVEEALAIEAKTGSYLLSLYVSDFIIISSLNIVDQGISREVHR